MPDENHSLKMGHFQKWVVPRFNRLQGRMITTGAVVTKATLFLQNARDGVAHFFELLASPKVDIRDSFQPLQLRAAAGLMDRCTDTPMDFVDATLVVLAAELDTDRVLTLDERGFRTYRQGRNQPFTMVLQED